MKKPSKDSLPLESKWLLAEDFEYLCFDFAREHMSFDEPIPDYLTRDTALLESALGSPRQSFDGKLLYPTIYKQAAILFYSLIKNHPFRNGNKRIAVMSLLVFLALNKKWLFMSPLRLYTFAYGVSETSAVSKNQMLKIIENFLEEDTKDFPQKGNAR